MESVQYHQQITGATAREIATSAERAICAGHLEPGERLPTVRALSTALGTSPATVGAAYRILRERGLVLGAGRRGTQVAPRPALRLARGPAPAAEGRRDLAHGLPDPALLPPLHPHLAALAGTGEPAALEATPALPELLELGRRGLAADGLPAGALTVLSGALDAIDRVLAAQLASGDRVAVEDPGYPPLRDLLRLQRLVEVPVAVDERGPRPEALAAVAGSVQALVLVPRAQNPFGAALDTARAQELTSVLAPHPGLLVIEDDHAGPVAGAAYASLCPGRERWAIIRSASKMLHPDLRLALVAGDEDTIARVEGRQALGMRWVSHLLQRLTARLLADPALPVTVQRARTAYAERRAALIEALADEGVRGHGRSGLNVWIPVPAEAPVLRAAADAGWLLAAGERFRLRTPPAVRVTVTALAPDEAPALAAVIAAAIGRGGLAERY
jgi:DNA-binding transcriptional MocR family regulator